MIQEFGPRENVWIARIRNSVSLGRGSCSTVDECMTDDDELREFLLDFDSFEEAWALLIDVEEIHWERSGIPWSASEEDFPTS